MTSTIRDGIIVITIAVMAYGTGVMFDVFEWLHTWSRVAEGWEIDEFLVPFFVLLAGSAWFALRRVRDLRAEVMKRQGSEATQRTTEEHFRNLIEGSIQGIIVQQDWKPLFVNQAYVDLLGYDSPKEILAMASIESQFAPYERERLRRYKVSRQRGEPAPTQYEYDMVRKDGSVITVQNLVRVIRWQGEPAVQSTLIDISERKRTEKALRESEARLTLAQKAADIGTADWDVKSDRVYWSTHQFRLHGVTPTKDRTISLKDWRALVHPDDGVKSAEVITASVKCGKGFSVEYRVVWPDGQVRWLCGTARVIRDDNGRALRMIGVSIDITERKRIEEALRESEERFALATEGSQDGLWYCADVNNESVEWWSPRWCELLGYKQHELKASLANFRALLHPDDRSRHKEMLRAHLEERTPFEIEYQLKTKSGQYRWFQCRAQAFWDERGKPIKMAGSLRDITEHKQAQDALRESEERLSLVLDATTEGIYDWNIQTGKVLNGPRWIESLGYPTDRVVPHMSFWKNLIHPADVPKTQKLLRNHLEGRTPSFVCEYRLRTQSGAYRWNLDHGKVVERNPQGEPVRMVGASIDITERKRAEEALGRFEGMVSASSDLMAFVDKTYTYLAANTAYVEALGKRKKEVIGKHVSDVLGRVAFDSRVKLHLDECLSGKHINYQLWLNLPACGSRYVDVRYDPYRDPNDLVSGVVVGIRDITENRQVEEALRKSEVRYRSIVENAPLCVYEIDTSGRLISMNPAGIRMMDLESQDDVIGMSCLDAVCYEDRGQVEQLLKRALAGEPATFEFSADTKLGRRVFTSSFNPIRTADGAIDKLMGMTQDITERKLAEDEMQQSRQRFRNLAAQLQAVREEERKIIAREVHDEMGQELTALKMDLVWIAKNLPKGWKTIPDRVHSMISLTDSTLVTVRQLSSRLRPAMLDDLGLEAAIEWQAQEFASRGNYGCGLDIKTTELRPDKKRDIVVFRILQEALTNVARHAAARQITVKLKTIDKTLLLQVADDGKGITDDALASTYSLGLTGMYERARTLGGNLVIERGANGKGTVLRLRVPHTSTKHAVHT